MPNSIIASDLVKSSMRLLGALGTGETPTADELNDGLAVLNDMLENLSTERMSVWSTADQTFTLVPGQATYTIGPGGNFNTVRPIRISDAYCTFSGVDFPVEIINQEWYNAISLKTMGQPIVERMLYVNEVPLGQITFWPVPTQNNTITLAIDKVLTFPVIATTALVGPPGFTKMLRYNLACEYAPDFGLEPTATVVAIASDSKADYKRANKVQVTAKYDDAITSPQTAVWQRGY